jgi:hypothetical protein
MSGQSWPQGVIVRGMSVIACAAAILVATEAGVRPGAAGTRHEAATFGIPGEGSVTDEIGRTDDGSIIIECVGFAGQARFAVDTADGSRIGTVAVPHRPLGPHTCSANEHKRT